eukprot:CAMPEP_0181288166 /NCGR_PEP_ID=MMETSP1101-20121128/183_1 /TAXON_ID=46948 /ORGANISM="Rhodomonas abbreviata, Strain Caron Lab Isolate" /LENGTH=491 /DNA_ID=CAMNT_0023392261 /DNA_START=147 /DNA_END=1622 /DNA_ORIENTATION=-
MPPKSAKGKDGADGEAGAAQGEGVVPGELDEDGKARPEDILELVAARQKLERSIKARQELTDANRQLREQLGQQKFEQSEIFAYLNKELLQKSKVVATLESKVGSLDEEVRLGRSIFDQKLMEEKSSAREATAKLAKEVGKYEKELGDLNMFISRKTELEGELEDTKTELLRERKKHEQIISELERKTVQEKERLRKEMEQKIREAKETFMKMTDSQLETTTKKTMHENEQMASELAFQNRETERLLQKNRKLADENLITRRELAMYKQAESELARRNHAYLKTIHSLLAKLKSLEGAKKDMERMTKDKEGFISTAYKGRVASLQESVEETYKYLDAIGKDLESKSTELSRLQQVKDDISLFIIQAAKEAKRRIAAAYLGERSPIDDEEGSEDRLAGLREQDVLDVRLDELPLEEREDVLRFIVARVSSLDKEAKRSTLNSPKSAEDAGGLFPQITTKRRGARSEEAKDLGGKSIQRDSRTEAGSVAGRQR